MPAEPANIDYAAITAVRVDVLRFVCGHHHQAEIARRLSLSRGAVKRHVGALEEISGCRDMLELARWWEEHRLDWLRWQAERAGIDWEGLIG